MDGAQLSSSDDARAEFHTLFVEMLPKVRTWLRRQGLQQEADDIAAETFTVIWRRWNDLPTEGDARRAYVFGVARKKALAARATRGRAPVASDNIPESPATGSDPADLVSGDDLVTWALALLPDGERDAVALTVLADLSPAQAAAELGCSPSAVTSRLHRARMRLRTSLHATRHLPDTDHEGGSW